MAQGVSRKGKIIYDLPPKQMFLDNAFEDRRGAGVIPDRLRIDERDGSAGANAQAVGLGPINQRLGPGQLELAEPPLQKLPGFQALRFGGTFRLRLVGTQKDVTPVPLDPRAPANACSSFAMLNSLESKLICNSQVAIVEPG